MQEHEVVRRLARTALRLVQSLAAEVAQPAGHRPGDLYRHTRHDLMQAAVLARRLRDGDRVLDIGCAEGRRLEALSLFRRIDPVGLEIQPAAVRSARVDVRAFDGSTVPLPDGSCDVVMICYVLHHLEREHARRLIAEARRVARREILLLEDSRPRWTLPYRIRNLAHRVESDLAYGAAAEVYRSPGSEGMFLTYDEWRAFLAQQRGLGEAEVVPLESISRLTHHTLIQVPVAA